MGIRFLDVFHLVVTYNFSDTCHFLDQPNIRDKLGKERLGGTAPQHRL